VVTFHHHDHTQVTDYSIENVISVVQKRFRELLPSCLVLTNIFSPSKMSDYRF